MDNDIFIVNWNKLMNGHHTPGTAINCVFWRVCWICSLSISWCMSYIRINIISWFHLLYLSLFGSYIMYLCLTNIILSLFMLFCFCFVLCMCIHVDAYIFICGSFIYVCVFVLMYFWFCVHTHKHSIFSIFIFIFLSSCKVGLVISRTNAYSQWNPAYNAFHRIFCCGNETIRR